MEGRLVSDELKNKKTFPIKNPQQQPGIVIAHGWLADRRIGIHEGGRLNAKLCAHMTSQLTFNPAEVWIR
jgi:hypothetical protein